MPSPTDSLLLDYVKRLEKRANGRHAIHLHLSRLSEENQRDNQIRLVADLFTPLVDDRKGQIFIQSNNDIYFIYDGTCRDVVQSTIVRLKFLFSSDPLSERMTENDEALISKFDLSRQYKELLQDIQGAALNNIHHKVATPAPKRTGFSRRPNAKSHGKPLTPAMLAKVEKALSGTDFANMIRRQSVCAIVGNSPPQVLFDEVFVAIGDLRDTVLPDIDLVSSPWLFQHMTETLDRRVLSNINKHDDGSLNRDFSINLNVSTILSPDFLKFDDNINASMRSTIVLELQMVDIFSDLAAFLLARDFAHERGYRLCIDGVSCESLPYVNRAGLKGDMIKVIWNDTLANMLTGVHNRFERDLKKVGPDRVIVCRVDDSEAIELAQSHGISMFQGRYVQRVLFSDPRKRRIGTVLVR